MSLLSRHVRNDSDTKKLEYRQDGMLRVSMKWRLRAGSVGKWKGKPTEDVYDVLDEAMEVGIHKR